MSENGDMDIMNLSLLEKINFFKQDVATIVFNLEAENIFIHCEVGTKQDHAAHMLKNADKLTGLEREKLVIKTDKLLREYDDEINVGICPLVVFLLHPNDPNVISHTADAIYSLVERYTGSLPKPEDIISPTSQSDMFPEKPFIFLLSVILTLNSK